MINDIINFGRTFLKGRFTYSVAGLSIIWALFGATQDYITVDAASVIISTAFSAIGIRRAIPDAG